MAIIRYRLVFRNGSHGAWTTDKKAIEESAKFFGAMIETWEVILP